MSVTDEASLFEKRNYPNGASAWLVFLVAFVAALLGLLTDDPWFSTGVNIVAITLFCLFSLTMLNDYRVERAKVSKLEERQDLISCVQSIVMHETDAVILTDLDGEILYRNAAAEKAWSRGELMGKFMEPRVSVSSEDRRA